MNDVEEILDREFKIRKDATECLAKIEPCLAVVRSFGDIGDA